MPEATGDDDPGETKRLLTQFRHGSESLRQQPGKTRNSPPLLKSGPQGSILFDRWACLEARPTQQVHLATDLSQETNLVAKDLPRTEAMKKRLEELTARPMHAAATKPRPPFPIEAK